MSSHEVVIADASTCPIEEFGCGAVVPGFIASSLLSQVRDELSLANWIEAQIGQYSGNTFLGAAPDPTISTALVTRQFTSQALDISHLRAEISKILRRRFGFAPTCFSPYSVSKYRPGSALGLHADTGVYNTKRVFTNILYLTDSYTGGRISFPEVGVRFQPSAGDLLCFYSELRHSVEEVTSGERLALVMFAENGSLSVLQAS